MVDKIIMLNKPTAISWKSSLIAGHYHFGIATKAIQAIK